MPTNPFSGLASRIVEAVLTPNSGFPSSDKVMNTLEAHGYYHTAQSNGRDVFDNGGGCYVIHHTGPTVRAVQYTNQDPDEGPFFKINSAGELNAHLSRIH